MAYTGTDTVKGYGAEQPMPSSPFDRLTMFADRLMEIAEHSERLADRLVGAQPPQQTAAGKLSENSPGLLDGLDIQTRRMNDLGSRIQTSLSRISDRL